MDFAYTIPCLVDSPIYLIGYSLGAAVALSVAARNEVVRGVVGWAPVSDLQAVFRSLLGEEAFVAALMQREVPCRNDSKQFYMKSSFFHDLNKHHPIQDIAKLAPRPVLLIQGTADTKVLPGQTQELFSSASGPKELHMIDNAPHSFAYHEEELFGITLNHLRNWNRDAWYASDKHQCGTPNGNPHPTGSA
jgi:putative redox protein